MDRNCALQDWNNLVMQPDKVDYFIDELIRLANVLGYSGNFVKDKARISMTATLRNAWALIRPALDYM